MGQRLIRRTRYVTALLAAVGLAVPTSAFAAQTVQFTSTQGESINEDSVQFTTQAAEDVDAGVSFETQSTNSIVWPQVDSYFAAFVFQNAYPRLTVDQSYKFSVTVRNIGATPWRDDVVFLGTSRPQDRIPSLLREDVVDANPSGWVSENRVEMLFDDDTGLPAGDANENGVIDPEETATFDFWMSVPDTIHDGAYKEYFNLVAEDITWFDDIGIYWDRSEE